LLFFHCGLNGLVAIELKICELEAEFLVKLNFIRDERVPVEGTFERKRFF